MVVMLAMLVMLVMLVVLAGKKGGKGQRASGYVPVPLVHSGAEPRCTDVASPRR